MSGQDIFIIVGGGISGFSLAHYCAKRGLKPIVLEKEDRMGGSFNTHRTDHFWWELGAHTCYNSYGNLIDLLAETGLLAKIIKPGKAGYRLYKEGRIKGLLSELDIPGLLVSVPNFFSGARKEGETVQSYYSKMFGQKNFERLIGPLFSAVVCQRANDFPADMLFKKRPRRTGVIKKFTFSGGLQTIVETIAAEPAITVLKGKEVREVGFDAGVFAVHLTSGEKFESGRLGLAVPPGAAASLLQKSFPALSGKLSVIGTERVETVGVVVKKEAVKLPPIAALAASDDIFYSFVSRDTFPDDLYRAFAFHFKAGRSSQEEKLARIGAVLGTRSFEQVVTAGHVVPSLRTGHEKLIEDINAMTRKLPLFITGNYFTGLAIEDCVSRSLNESRRMAP